MSQNFLVSSPDLPPLMLYTAEDPILLFRAGPAAVACWLFIKVLFRLLSAVISALRYMAHVNVEFNHTKTKTNLN